MISIKRKLFIISSIFFLCTFCTPKIDKTPENWNSDQLNKWFDTGDWKQDWEVKIDKEIDKKEFAGSYFKHKERWDLAFGFLKNTKLADLKPGRYYLDSTNVYVIVDKYETKDIDNTRFEAHKKYADIQYLISGEELIGVVPLKETKEIVPYSSEKDIAFYKSDENKFRLATPNKLFIFFPDNAHRPGVQAYESKTAVLKIVIKVKINS